MLHTITWALIIDGVIRTDRIAIGRRATINNKIPAHIGHLSNILGQNWKHKRAI